MRRPLLAPCREPFAKGSRGSAFRRVLPIRRIRGWVGAEPERPQAYAWGYMLALLRSSIRMACRGRLAG